ncbi:chromate transport protein ChrA [Gracilibacillus halotolerans]|uniref:Chromate transport protein ChrA n=1 Tax=Gracilibacillus halotolerans TaxID=74386 RepID=A0A841REA3_9BACI|nr:chromate transport protein ChrA [Gracilibacillus halotolerans]
MFDIISLILYFIALFNFPFATLGIMIGLGLIVLLVYKSRSKKKRVYR